MDTLLNTLSLMAVILVIINTARWALTAVLLYLDHISRWEVRKDWMDTASVVAVIFLIARVIA